MKFLFKKKVNVDKVKTLEQQLYYNQKEDYNDFISILEQIQETNNENLQWKRRQCIINNEIDLALENYRNKIIELDISA